MLFVISNRVCDFVSLIKLLLLTQDLLRGSFPFLPTSGKDPAWAGQGKAFPMPCSLLKGLVAGDAAGGLCPASGAGWGWMHRSSMLGAASRAGPCRDAGPRGGPEELARSSKASASNGREGSSKKLDVTGYGCSLCLACRGLFLALSQKCLLAGV